MSTLYEVTGRVLALQDLMLDEDLDEQTIADTIEAIEGEYEIKLENYCKVIKNLEADVEALTKESKRLTDKKKSLENNIKRLKEAMFNSMKATETTKVKGEIFTVAIQKNGGKLPVVVDVPTEELPDDLVRVVESPDLEAIAKMLENGESPLAHFGERGESLRIK